MKKFVQAYIAKFTIHAQRTTKINTTVIKLDNQMKILHQIYQMLKCINYKKVAKN